MTRMVPVLAVTLAVAMLLAIERTANAAPVPEDAHFALVIGNSAYTGMPPLPGCTASSHLVTAALKRAGFTVTEQLDQTVGQMDAALGAVADAANSKPGSSAVVYICGYAVGFHDRTFLLPVSASIERETDVLSQGLLAKSVLDTIRRSNAVAGLVLLDTVAKPGSSGNPALVTLTSAPPEGNVGVAAASIATVPPQSGTALAVALSAAMAGPDIQTDAVLAELQQRVSSASGTRLVVRPPAQSVWLAGGPPPAPPAPSPQVATPALVPPASTPPTAPAVTFPDEADMTAADRERIQTALLHLGYYNGKVDGIFGPDTRAAIRRFQHEIGAGMTGRITPAEVSRLIAASQ